MIYAILYSSKNSNIVKFYDFYIRLKNFIKKPANLETNLSNFIKSKYKFFGKVLSYLQSLFIV